jgi:hypothetical protein
VRFTKGRDELETAYFTDNLDDVLYGQATDDGYYDDVETYDETGSPAVPGARGVDMLAWGYVVVSLAALWLMGAAVFKGSNQS